MERHRCKLCFRDFPNGRALGGHMRSHMMNFIPLKDAPNQEKERESSDFSNSYSSSEDQEQSTETESSMETSRKSKRARKSRVFYSDPLMAAETEPLSSVSDTTSEDEHVAYCLMMLSRDKWSKQEIEEEEEEEEQDSEIVIKRNNKIRGKYRCESCGKLFKSYQALGGHRASHKKIRVSAAAAPPPAAAPVVVERVHECPFCERVFSSGQALGGHKRSHFINGAPNVSSNNDINKGLISRSGEISLDIDLNRPAPVDDV